MTAVQGRTAPPPPIPVPILLVAALYLLGTGRWGAYVGVPGLPIFIGDVLVVAGLVQTLRALRRARAGMRDVGRMLADAPLGLLLSLALLAWAAIRLAAGVEVALDDPLVALRDAAPYAYAIVALLAFLLPAADGALQRRLVYATLTVHAVWVVGAGYLPGWPWENLLLGDAPIFTSRPDVDSAVMGMSIALALHELDLRDRRGVGLRIAFLALNAYAATTLPTRAGFLAGVVGVSVVLLLRLVRPGSRLARLSWPARAGVMLAAVGVLVGAIAVTPPGHRVVEGIQGLRGEATQASGTIAVREFVWGGVADYTTADFGRTAFGVGFGPDFIDASGTEYALEGTEYKDVRSPHNYVLGSLGRLGVAGALLAALMLLANVVLGLRALMRSAGTVTALAALVLITTPVTALLGVVLESPFGAIPYFWAVGQLSRAAWEGRAGDPGTSRGDEIRLVSALSQAATVSRYQR